jgi:Domain of unknown function (DUF4153)
MNRFAKLLPDLFDVLRRFPVPAFCCVWAFAISFFQSSGFYSGFGEPEIFGLTAAFLAAGAAHLIAETHKWNFLVSLAVAILAAGAAGLLAFEPSVLQSHRLFLFLGLVLVLFVAPYVRHGVHQGAIWLFGLRIGLAAILALTVGLTLVLGLIVLVGGLKFLFGIDLGGALDNCIGSLSIYLVGPMFGLAMVPRNVNDVVNLEDHKDGLLERGVSILVNYIKVPLAFVYALLLHSYAIKIMVQQSLPKGEVGFVVTLFAIAGTLSWLIAWPFRDTGTRLLKAYARYWFWFLPVPIVLLVLAVWQRVNEHGMTQDRYGLVLVALWAALVCGYLMLRRSFADMRVIIGGAAALLLAGSFGPLGAVRTTIDSQLARFDHFLNDNAMLENGKLKTLLPPLAQDKKLKGYSFLEILTKANAIQNVEKYMPTGETLPALDGRSVSAELSKRFGVENYWQDAAFVSFNTTMIPAALPFSGEGILAGPFQFGSWALNEKTGAGQAQFMTQGKDIALRWVPPNAVPAMQIILEQRTILQLIKNLKPAPVGGNQMPITHVIDQKYALILTEGSGQLSDTKAELASLSFWVVANK